jgi:hypothetical protein
MCRELRNEIQKKYREVAEKPRGNLRTALKSGADERIRTGDPLLQIRIYGVRSVSISADECRFVFGCQKFRADKYR